VSYIANTQADQQQMLAAIGIGSIDELFSQIPNQNQFRGELDIPSAMDNLSLGKHMSRLARLNADCESQPTFLGAGVYDHYVPPTVGAILGRSEFYTSYTPYQPEVSQGVLQSIYEFQTLIGELFGMDVANASMYDCATALAEAAIMASDITGRKRVLLVDTVHPSYCDVVATYLRHVGIEIKRVPSLEGAADLAAIENTLGDSDAAILVQHPNFYGNLEHMSQISSLARTAGALVVEAVDPISLGLLQPPGYYGVDIAVGEGQSLGCPLGFGGPQLGLFSCKQEYIRRLPGRVVGETKDLEGRRAFVMTLRTREQDIRRERATSNICTNVALYALAATVYLATMGKTGVRQVAELSTRKAHYAASQIQAIAGYSLTYPNASFFKEFSIETRVSADQVNEALWNEGIMGGYKLGERSMLLAVTEMRTREEIDLLTRTLARL